jgi:hypothetical protein
VYVDLGRRRARNWGGTAARSSARVRRPVGRIVARADCGIDPPTGYHVRDAFFAATCE